MVRRKPQLCSAGKHCRFQLFVTFPMTVSAVLFLTSKSCLPYPPHVYQCYQYSRKIKHLIKLPTRLQFWRGCQCKKNLPLLNPNWFSLARRITDFIPHCKLQNKQHWKSRNLSSSLHTAWDALTSCTHAVARESHTQNRSVVAFLRKRTALCWAGTLHPLPHLPTARAGGKDTKGEVQGNQLMWKTRSGQAEITTYLSVLMLQKWCLITLVIA